MRRVGPAAKADGGTILLDEIGEISLSLQSKLLQVLQDREFSRLGGKKYVKVDVRVLASTNKNMEQAVNLGKFREDLYYRLNVVNITVPPLRERKEDIPLLARHFLRKYAERMKKETLEFSQGAYQKLMGYSWPGNVRELENCVESAVAMADKKVISEDAVLRGKATGPSGPMAFKDAKSGFERQY